MNQPPKLPLRFLRWFCHPDLLPSIEGDLIELYEENIKEKGTTKSKLLFTYEILRLVRKELIQPLDGYRKINHYGMLKNYFKTTIRNARREKAFTALNVFCLAVGFAVCLYVSLFSIEEMSFDKFHHKAERIYRINQTFIWGERDELFGSTGPAVMEAIQSEVPEFETMCRIHPLENAPLVNAVIDGNISKFEEDGIRAVDSTFFKVFTFPLVKGNPETALNYPMSVVLTEETALKYFGTTDVLGKQLIIDDSEVKGTFQVTGIAAEIPRNSHVDFDMLISLNSIPRLKRASDSWWWTTFVTFGVLRPDANPDFVAQKVAQVPGKYLEPFLVKYKGITYKEFIENGETWELYIQPLLDIHLHSQHVFSRLNEIGDITNIYIMATIASLILLLSVINFVNLTTARSARRSKEVGVRKVLGSNRQNLIWQFMFESLMFCFVALLLSCGLLLLFIDQFNAISGREIHFSSIGNPILYLSAISFAIVIGLLAGIYPAFYLSAFRPVKVLKSHVMQGAKGSLVRNALVTAQFTVSIALIACALIVQNQVQFWLKMDLGYNRDKIIIVKNAERLGQSMETFKTDLLSLPSIEYVSLGSDTPPYIWDGDDNFKIAGADVEKHIASFWVSDEDFADIFNLQFIAGRDFDKGKDRTPAVIVTRSLIEKNGIFDPKEVIGKTLEHSGSEARIVGVIENFNAEFGWKQSPMAYFNDNVTFYHRKNREVAIRYRGDLSNEALAQLLIEIDEKWQNINPGMPMVADFLDETFRQEFQPTIDFGRMIQFYSVLAIIIAGLGLTGLVSYVIDRRTKEIGIRKVLGASISSILVLLSSEFGKLLLIGFVIASALSWVLMSRWIQDFDYQAPIQWYVFGVAGLVMLSISVLTIGYQTFKSAKANPVNALKDE
ncbi:MAG: ABC transporter permease [Cyclobacteriaceae bacterium]